MRNLKTLWLSTVASLAFAASAFAADLRAPVTAKAPAANPLYNWSGFYLGATAGAAWSRNDIGIDVNNDRLNDDFLPVANALGPADLKGSGLIVGAKAGHNWQAGQWVIGLEGDISYLNADATKIRTGFSFGGSDTFTHNSQSRWLATFRPRIGFAVDRMMIYGTAGLAFLRVQSSSRYEDGSERSNVGAGSVSVTKVGWAAGGGFDYVLTDNWILSAEYLHVDLGVFKNRVPIVDVDGISANFDFSNKFTTDIVRGGLAYKF